MDLKPFMRHSFLFLFVFSMLVVNWGCNSDSDSDGINEGVIEFEASAVDSNNPMADLAPNKMLVKFKDNKSVAEMSAGMGLLTMSFVSDYDKKIVTQLVKLLNKKYSSVSTEDDIKRENEASPIVIEKSNESKIIAGYRCKKAVVNFKDNSHLPFDIFYTDEIELEKPNWNNVFHEIDGVLMEYQLTRYNLELRFTAQRVVKATIEDSDFETPSDYKPISQKELEELFIGMQ